MQWLANAVLCGALALTGSALADSFVLHQPGDRQLQLDPPPAPNLPRAQGEPEVSPSDQPPSDLPPGRARGRLDPDPEILPEIPAELERYDFMPSGVRRLPQVSGHPTSYDYGPSIIVGPRYGVGPMMGGPMMGGPIGPGECCPPKRPLKGLFHHGRCFDHCAPSPCKPPCRPLGVLRRDCFGFERPFCGAPATCDPCHKPHGCGHRLCLPTLRLPKLGCGEPVCHEPVECCPKRHCLKHLADGVRCHVHHLRDVCRKCSLRPACGGETTHLGPDAAWSDVAPLPGEAAPYGDSPLLREAPGDALPDDAPRPPVFNNIRSRNSLDFTARPSRRGL